MTPWKIRGLGVGLLAGACAGLLDVTSMLTAAPAFADDGTDYTALVLGHAFLATPNESYIQQVIDTYVDPSTPFLGQPTYNVTNALGVTTPETNYTTGLTEGVKDLNTAIYDQLNADPTNPDPNVVVTGYSMSNSVITQEMINLANTPGGAPDVDGLKFVLAENLNNPDGGFFTRLPDFGGVSLPPTPADTPYDTTIYSIEYSGASDYPEYTGDQWAVSNAADGYVDLHPYLLPGWPAYFDPSTVSQSVSLDSNIADPMNTSYYLIPTQTLPMFDGPFGPSAYDDLIQPDMRVLVDLGYDWQSDPSVATPAVADNPNIDFTAVDSLMHAGADQGTIAYLVDLHILPESDLAGIADLYPYAPDIQDLIGGALNNEPAAAMDASMSADLLTTDLAGATNPLASYLDTFAPQLADHIADMFIHMASTLGP